MHIKDRIALENIEREKRRKAASSRLGGMRANQRRAREQDGRKVDGQECRGVGAHGEDTRQLSPWPIFPPSPGCLL
jgi:hypothetical protein